MARGTLARAGCTPVRGRVRYDAGLGRFRFRLLAVALAVAAGQGEQLHEQQRLHAQGHELRGDEPRVAW